MRFYTARIDLGGDRNHVVVKDGLSPAEILALSAIHGAGSVHTITPDPGGNDKTPHREIITHLEANYGRTRVGGSDNRAPVLQRVFPGWPNVTLPADAKAAGINPSLMAEEAQPKKATSKPQKFDKAAAAAATAGEDETPDFTE